MDSTILSSSRSRRSVPPRMPRLSQPRQGLEILPLRGQELSVGCLNMVADTDANRRRVITPQRLDDGLVRMYYAARVLSSIARCVEMATKANMGAVRLSRMRKIVSFAARQIVRVKFQVGLRQFEICVLSPSPCDIADPASVRVRVEAGCPPSSLVAASTAASGSRILRTCFRSRRSCCESLVTLVSLLGTRTTSPVDSSRNNASRTVAWLTRRSRARSSSRRGSPGKK